MKFQKYLGFFKVFWDQIPKNLGYFWNSSKFQKNIEFSKIPKFQKIHQSSQNFLEFWKTQGFFGILMVENLEKPKVFLEFIMKFQKTLGFFKVFNLSFPKFQNSKKFINPPKYFWNFGKPKVFF